ncbi:MAG: serine/threonine-protein kinase [bacterium]
MNSPRKLAGYELIDRLAVGGMAEIYLARSRSIQGFEKEYVLKLIHPKHSGDKDFLRMLVDEAKLTAQLHHTNIAQVIDLGLDQDHYFIVMEYIRGKDLFQVLNQAYDMRIPVPLDVCAWIMKETLAGLYYAHTKRDEVSNKPLDLVHRDISPQNIILGWQGEVKVLDFGVAKAAQAARPETQAGIIKGKFRYMSPEQAWGEKLDGRSDMFSAALCLYEMSTSSMAYEDEPDMRKMLVRMREAKFTDPRNLRSDMDREFHDILMKGLERRRQDRYENCEAFERALTRYLYKHTPDFTRADVRAFLAAVFPDEAPYDPAEVPSRSPEQLTEPVPVLPRDPVPKPSGPELDTLQEDTGDETVRRSIVGGRFAVPSDDFDANATELFSSSHPAAQTNETKARRSQLKDALRNTAFGEPAEPIRPQPIPTSWLPKEVPEDGKVSAFSHGTSAPTPASRLLELFDELHRVINGKGTPEENKRYAILGFVVLMMITNRSCFSRSWRKFKHRSLHGC